MKVSTVIGVVAVAGLLMSVVLVICLLKLNATAQQQLNALNAAGAERPKKNAGFMAA